MRRKTDNYSKLIYYFIEAYWKEYGYSPMMEEIAQGVELAYNTTRHYLLDLQSWGLIDWKPHTIRTIQVVGTLE